MIIYQHNFFIQFSEYRKSILRLYYTLNNRFRSFCGTCFCMNFEIQPKVFKISIFRVVYKWAYKWPKRFPGTRLKETPRPSSNILFQRPLKVRLKATSHLSEVYISQYDVALLSSQTSMKPRTLSTFHLKIMDKLSTAEVEIQETVWNLFHINQLLSFETLRIRKNGTSDFFLIWSLTKVDSSIKVWSCFWFFWFNSWDVKTG